MTARIADLITPNACETTVAGWIWYCDNCVTHGNADSSEEADFMAKCHLMYHTSIFMGDTENEEEYEDDSKYVAFRNLLPDEQEMYEYELEEASPCYVFIINVNKNKTFQYGEDYTDETPNQVVDIEIAQEIRKKLGLP